MADFDFGNANCAQRKAITTTEGPVLITAGPGTGKTFTLVQRVLYLIQEKGVEPERIFVATFTEKAAKELVTRLTNELDARGVTANLTEMYVGTFHSLALRIIKENIEYSRLKQGYRVLDSFEQQYMVYRNFNHFENIDSFSTLFPGNSGRWGKSGALCAAFNELAEELVAPESLLADSSENVQGLGRLYQAYREMLVEENFLDFPAIQSEAYRILRENPRVLEKYREQISHIMIDEYQDTNYVQEQLVFALAGERRNICVVGDDDQGLYRFRGATIRNIIEFPDKFALGECTQVSLVDNYRSHPTIVDFYNTWMETTSAEDEKGKEIFSFDWANFRFPKTIKATKEPSRQGGQAVYRLTDRDSSPGVEGWYEEVLAFINNLRESGKLEDLNQIAFLFKSVKSKKAVGLEEFLEAHGVPVYSPRSALFFDRDEVRLSIGCLLAMFPRYAWALEAGDHKVLQHDSQKSYVEYLLGCVEYAVKVAQANPDLARFIEQYQDAHLSLQGSTDYAYAALYYRLFRFEPFASWLNTPAEAGVADSRALRNIAAFTQILGRFEHLYAVTVLSAKGKGRPKIESLTENLFNTYLRLLWKEGIGEYEDDAEYAPRGCVSFLTVHQSKGMEFPVVVADSFESYPRRQGGALPKEIAGLVEERHYQREPFEPAEQIKFFDFWRLYYTAFSRAQNLLICSYPRISGRGGSPSKYFRTFLEGVPSIDELDVANLELESVKPVNIKQALSFTSHIMVYETCSLQYRFFKDLEFAPVRVAAQLFGKVIHQTIEDVHRAALRGEEASITPENVNAWFDANYTYLSKAERSYLAPSQLDFALSSVHRYVKRQSSDWSIIKQAEVDVSLVKPDYILEGTVDLIRGEGGTVEIVDFKSSRKPDMRSDKELLERYKRQLHIYAHLVEQRTGEKVSKLHLYYTGEPEDSNPQISWNFSPTAVEGTVAAFDDTAHKILARDYGHKAEKAETCKECDLRAWCGDG